MSVSETTLHRDIVLEKQVEQLREALKSALERLEASQPPRQGATEKVCRQVRKALLETQKGAL